MPKSIPIKQRPRRERTFRGCGTCRRRHVKCDQTQPHCLTCRNLGVECEGFVPDLRWVVPELESANDGDVSITRRHLYSEQARKRMATSLSEGLIDGSVDASLQDVDNLGRAESIEQAGLVAIGPFGVFDSRVPTEDIQKSAKKLSASSESPVDVVASVGPSPVEILPQVEWDSVNSVVSTNDVLQWDDIFGLDFDNIYDPSINMLDPLLAFNDSGIDHGHDFIYSRHELDHDPPDLSFNTRLSKTLTFAQPSPSVTDVLDIAPTLLKHFKKHVIHQISALPITSKSPWEIVNLVSAVDTYAHLTFLETNFVTNARRAGLYGLLCLSATHLAKNPTLDTDLDRQAGYWDVVAEVCKSEATQHLQHSLVEELHGPNKAKYKDQLTGILNLLAVCIIVGAQKDARCLMIEAERLMRLRGLSKREVSRKSRLLHHMYTWVRIVCESTYVLHDYAAFTERLQLRLARSQVAQKHHTHAIAAENKLDDFLRFESHSTESERENVEDTADRARETALRDIHLEDLRENPNTMYGMIYGISETWLRLLSQTTRLANQMDAIKASEDITIPSALLRKASTIEDAICTFASTSSSSTSGDLPNDHINDALNSALVIFFYRRIRAVNPWILQSHVDNIIRALASFDRLLVRHGVDGPGLAWPAFMGACEAIATTKRNHLMHWIESAGAKTGLHYYHQAKEVIEEVWRSKDALPVRSDSTNRNERAKASSQLSSATWMDVLREKKIWLMAC